MAVTLETPLSRVLGPKTATSMAEQLALHTVRDLLRHYPRRYASRGEQADLADVQVGDRVTVLAQVRSVTTRPMRNRRGSLTEVVVGDGSGRMKLVFFNHRHAALKVDAWGMFAGTVGSTAARSSSPTRTCTCWTATAARTTGPARSSRSTRRARTSPAGSSRSR
ncbi:hypothetical protein [Blastococcus brunescens]|uniref:RecG wedge domain-containing protein n=1 Tax=Blastococcus brunescens TaxID=1564165 RepID=A0ABZ1AY59_9ACTN|nr:hypothetical protein [Blastococcus sp. BMG 8361]WRL62583.1 hypothetical protein U6N30_21765 [Blastococcus sp. BMG 8361]